MGFTNGFNIGSKASSVLVPTAAALAGAYGGHELAEHFLIGTEFPEHIRDILSYAGAGAGALTGAGAGWLSRYTYVPQAVCGTAGGLVGVTLELSYYAVAISVYVGIEGTKKFQKWRTDRNSRTIDDTVIEEGTVTEEVTPHD